MNSPARPVLAPASAANLAGVDLRALAERIFADAAAMSPDRIGLSRPAYSAVESRMLAYLEETARGLGLETWRDPGDNLVVAAPGDTDPAARAGYFGSHVDTVPEGGNYDGLAGVVAALLALLANLRDGARSGRVPLRVIALRGEESAWFGRAYMGSLALFGRLGAAALESKRRDGVGTLADAMRETGLPVERIAASEPLADPKSFAFFVELHIEQGPVLVERKWPVAGVTGIRGNIRHREIRCLGEAGHSGAIPRWLRRDAVFAMCELVMRMDEHWATIQQHGGDLVLTTGIVQTDPAHHAMSRIPGEVSFSFEARSLDAGTLEAVERLAHAEARAIERDRGVRFLFDEPVRSAPASLDPAILQAILAAAEAEDLPGETVPSGAGHDAAVFAQACVPSGMIFVRNTKGSHNPNEHMEIDDLMAAVRLMTRLGETLADRAR